ncbi:MAG: CarD family transcriptional regulator [Fibrobacter sp.]|nr:CarD family transcriptional regulator [Fibrobacter sp.]
MFQTGDRVVYGIHGVCDIVGTEIQIVDKKEVVYLVLEPLAQPGSRYMVPSHNPAAMKKVKQILTCSELERMIRSEAVRTDCWTPAFSRAASPTGFSGA